MALTTTLFEKEIDTMAVKSNTSKSGKKQGEIKAKGYIRKKDITGRRFGRLVVQADIGRAKDRQVIWECLCDCGNMVPVCGSDLQTGNTKSCGCLRKEMMTTHGMYGTTTYKAWNHMIDRCNNQNNSTYCNYGGRGITVCKPWLKFENFFKDMKEKPKGLTLERKNNNLGYFKLNCCWATRLDQSRNRRAHKDNITGNIGVCWLKQLQKYRVQIKAGEKNIHLGYFADINDAIQARKIGELKYWNK